MLIWLFTQSNHPHPCPSRKGEGNARDAPTPLSVPQPRDEF